MSGQLRPRARRRRQVPSRTAILALVALAGALAYRDNLVWVFVVIYAAVLVVLLAAAWSWWCGRHLHLFRDTRAGAWAVGQQLVERFTLENNSGLPIRLVEVCDQSRLPGARATRAFSLAPRQVATWETSRRLTARGRYELGPTELRLADPLGLFPRRLSRPAGDVLVVCPALVAVPGRSLPGSSPAGDLLVLLDLRQECHRGQGEEGSLEYAVTAAASVAHAAAGLGRAVALATSDRQLTRIPAGRGELHDRNLMDFLATVRDDGSVPFAELVRRELRSWRGRGGVVLITPDSTSDWVEEAAAASLQGERALAIFVDPAGFSGALPGRLPAHWRLALDLWVVRHGDDLARLDAVHGQAVV